MTEVLSVVGRLAPTDVTVTLTGETGTGKDVFAHMVHDMSQRASRPFVVFDCGAVPANLRRERAVRPRARRLHGRARRAPRARSSAPRAARCSSTRLASCRWTCSRACCARSTTTRSGAVGGTTDRRVDVRIVAATNRDLGALVAAKQFRQDLYFRLAAAIVQLPPLRERLDDLPLLVPRAAAGSRPRVDLLVPEATIAALRAHSWPGNVRELKNVLACALAFVGSGAPEPRHLRFVAAAVEETPLDRLPLGGHSLVALERAAIRQTLLTARGNKVHAREGARHRAVDAVREAEEVRAVDRALSPAGAARCHERLRTAGRS